MPSISATTATDTPVVLVKSVRLMEVIAYYYCMICICILAIILETFGCSTCVTPLVLRYGLLRLVVEPPSLRQRYSYRFRVRGMSGIHIVMRRARV